jgi:hypothetical protein
MIRAGLGPVLVGSDVEIVVKPRARATGQVRVLVA